MHKIRFLIALWAAKLSRQIVNIVDRKRGTNLPGKIALKLCPDFICQVKGLQRDKTIAITGTNGKSTSNNMIVKTLTGVGEKVASNIEGANMVGGVATTLVDNSNIFGRFRSDWLCLEVDERSLPAVSKSLPIGFLCITNIQKDQIQRNAEPSFIFDVIRSAITPETHLILNADEPRSYALSQYANKCSFYAVEPHSLSRNYTGKYSVSMLCEFCQTGIIKFSAHNLYNIGPFSCSNCNLTPVSNNLTTITAADFENSTFKCDGYTFHMHYSEPVALYSYALTIALCKTLSIDPVKVGKTLDGFKPPAGRKEIIDYKGKKLIYYRIKQENPDTVQSAINAVAAIPGKRAVVLCLNELTDFQPFYTGSYYAYDCDFSSLLDENIIELICYSKYMSADEKNILYYQGFNKDTIVDLPSVPIDNILDYIEKSSIDKFCFITHLDWYLKFIKAVERRLK